MMYCKTTFVSITVFLLAMFSSDFVGAGELAANLEKQILSASPDQPVKVWIKLQAADDRTARRTAAVGKSISRVERYRTAANRLKDTHFEMQKTLLTELNRLRVEDRARNIKPHWLINAVEAEVSTGEIALLAARDDVEMIYPVPEIHLITPDKSDQIPAHGTAVSGVGQNLSAINADDVWATGFTGEGRLICSFDTGVDGDHPALSGNWKGNDGNYGAAWFFPYDTGDGTPRAVPDCGYTNGCAINHGTHVMGTMVGHDDATGDTTGVAPGAKWISAAVIDIAGTSIIDAFEWAVNPDGDLNTVDDVPD
ncbi:MAG: S8 family serine peptidase, partial [candidate division Zixibacteria bacterium]|nr:S8 family serine peptidase [candidate division Zixibacteria bacterium]